MRKISILLGLLFLLGHTSLQAQIQIKDKLLPHFGFMLEYPQAFLPNSDDGVDLPSFYNFNFGTYVSLAQKKDIISVGPMAELQLGGNLLRLDRLRFAYSMQVPVYAMVRLGAKSTIYNQQAVGLSVGVGGSFNRLSYFTAAGSTVENIRVNYVNPAAVVEVHINTRSTAMTLRAHASLARSPQANFKRFDLNGNPRQAGSPLQVGYVGLGIVTSLIR